MKFPGRSRLDSNPYPDVRGENLSASARTRRLEDEARENAHRLAVARYWLDEVPLEAVQPMGTTGLRWLVDGCEWRLSEEFVGPDQDPREAGVELFFVDRAGGVHYLRKPYGLDSGTGLSAAVVAGEVRGNMLITDDGKARRLR